MAKIRIQRVSGELQQAFFKLHCDHHEAGFCFCAAWYLDSWDDWEKRSADQNRAIRQDLFDQGVSDGFLVFMEKEEDPIGWIQVAPRDSIPRLGRQFNLLPDPGTWAIGCLLVRPDWQGKGIARKMVQEVLLQLPDLGARRVEAYPRSGSDLPSEELWNGPLNLYLSLGFEIVKEGSPRLVVALDL